MNSYKGLLLAVMLFSTGGSIIAGRLLIQKNMAELSPERMRFNNLVFQTLPNSEEGWDSFFANKVMAINAIDDLFEGSMDLTTQERNQAGADIFEIIQQHLRNYLGRYPMAPNKVVSMINYYRNEIIDRFGPMPQ